MKFTYSTGARPLEGFTIKRGIGSGGFGEVYYALSDAGKEVALKRIQRHLDIELRGVRQCLNLKHPNLLSLFDIRHDDHGDAWVVMEYIVGESLHELLERHPQGLPAPEVQRWFEGLAAGVGYLHDRGIVHRDLKPGNVFLDEGIVKIGDYGLSKYISCSRRSGQTESVGTFHYMAPEIGRGSYGRQIDIYALGIMLYEMFTGRLPFDGESSQEIIMKHLTADPDLSVVPSAYREVIRRALLKDPEKRFANVEEMVRAAGWSSVGLHGSPNVSAPVANSPTMNAAAPKVVADDAPILLAARDEVDRAKSNDANVEVVAAEIVTPGNASPGNGRARDNGDAGGGHGAAQHGKHAHAAGRAGHGGQAGHAGPAAPQMNAAAGGAEEEPIAKAMRQVCEQIVGWGTNEKVNLGLRLAVLTIAAIGVVLNAHWLFPLAVAAGIIYLIYFAVRAVFVAPTSINGSRPQAHPARTPNPIQQPNYARAAQVSPMAATAPYVPAGAAQPIHNEIPPTVVQQNPKSKASRQRTSEILRSVMARRSVRERLAEVTGASVLSVAIASVLCFLALLVGTKSFEPNVASAGVYAWLLGTTLAGAAAVLVLGKLWETSNGDAVHRRFVMLVTGLGVGFIAWGLQTYLGIDPLVNSINPAGPSYNNHGPLLIAMTKHSKVAIYPLYFAAQFLILRWWRQADALRPARLSLWDSGVCVLVAFIGAQFLPVALPWGPMLAASISLTVQLASPWVSSAERVRMRDEATAAA